MKTVICSGTLFSGWRDILNRHLPSESHRLSVYAEISALSKEICQQKFPGSNELHWKPFTPDSKYIEKVGQLFSSIENEPLFTWVDVNCSLNLNFWRAAVENAGFALFYSSPEYELSNFLNAYPYDESRIEKIIDAWIIRTQAMLTFFMNNRDRCLLINVQSADSADGSLVQALNKQFDLKLSPKPLSAPVSSENSPLVEYLATTLLLKNRHVSELYDELRSAATLISEQDKSILSIEERNRSLINAFLTDVSAYKQLSNEHSELESELSLNQLQINQMAEELELYFKKSIEQEKITNTMADYLSDDPLLKIARRVRQMQ